MSVWPFTDPPHAGVYTLDEILTGTSPLSRVVHDVVGDWQFLDDGELGERKLSLVSLAEMVRFMPSVSDLSDLPLGWSAGRLPGVPGWQRAPLYPADWSELVAMSLDHTQACQAELERTFEIGRWERFDCNQNTAELTWSSKGAVRVRADVRFVGSLSLRSGTWLWSWANSHILDDARAEIDWLEAFGQDNDYERLREARFHAEEVEAWELASVACMLLEAEGVYRLPSNTADTFVLLENLHFTT